MVGEVGKTLIPVAVALVYGLLVIAVANKRLYERHMLPGVRRTFDNSVRICARWTPLFTTDWNTYQHRMRVLTIIVLVIPLLVLSIALLSNLLS